MDTGARSKLKSETTESAVCKTISGENVAPTSIQKSQTKAFLSSLFSPADQHQIDGELRKRYVIGNYKPPKKVRDPRRCKSTSLSLAERRRLGLHRLPRKGLKYAEYLPLHRLWCDYMRAYLSSHQLPSVVGEQASLPLLKADYHGASVTVTRSKCPSLVGTSGILLMDSKNAFRLVCPDDTVRTVPKESSVFLISLDRLEFTIFGKHFQVKPSERSTKKIKYRAIADL